MLMPDPDLVIKSGEDSENFPPDSAHLNLIEFRPVA